MDYSAIAFRLLPRPATVFRSLHLSAGLFPGRATDGATAQFQSTLGLAGIHLDPGAPARVRDSGALQSLSVPDFRQYLVLSHSRRSAPLFERLRNVPAQANR